MHRAILQACIPLLIALAVGFVLLWAVARLSRGRWDLSKLRRLHQCQHGGVQSLSLVVTLPLFIMIVMFIIQISQLMVGVMVVNYSAFASARSASVWVPARTADRDENMMPEPIWEEDYPDKTLNRESIESREVFISQENADESLKYRRMFAAAVLGCAPISPSRDLGYQARDSALVNSAQRFYQGFDSGYENNRRIPIRIANKIGYSESNTRVRLRFLEWDTNRERYPTYNSLDPIDADDDGTIDYYGFERDESDWQNAIEVTVFHDFALLPGPGRFLAKYIVRADGRDDRTADRIETSGAPNGRPLYTTLLSATATMTNEGFKSVLPYEQTPY